MLAAHARNTRGNSSRKAALHLTGTCVVVTRVEKMNTSGLYNNPLANLSVSNTHPDYICTVLPCYEKVSGNLG